eukprot:6210861-Pleurochrysis_carterae.AAC.2
MLAAGARSLRVASLPARLLIRSAVHLQQAIQLQLELSRGNASEKSVLGAGAGLAASENGHICGGARRGRRACFAAGRARKHRRWRACRAGGGAPAVARRRQRRGGRGEYNARCRPHPRKRGRAARVATGAAGDAGKSGNSNWRSGVAPELMAAATTTAAAKSA